MPFISPTLGVSTLNNSLIFPHLTLDAGENSLGHAELVVVVSQSLFFAGVGDEGCFNQNRRNPLSLQHSKSGLLHLGLMQIIQFADLLQHRVAESKAVVDLPGVGHINQNVLHGAFNP